MSFYARALREVFRGATLADRPAFFFVASAFHSFGHAGLALAAGRCAVLLAGAVAGGGSGAAARGDPLETALVFGAVGVAAAVAKTVGGVFAARGQAKIASRVAARLRLEVLDDWFARYRLRRPRQRDHGHLGPPPMDADGPALAVPLPTAAQGVSALTARVAEVETGLAQGLLGGARAAAQLLPLLGALLWISPKLAVAALAVLTPFSLVLSSSRRAWRRAHTAAARDSEELLQAADEAIRHADLWVSYSAEARARAVVAELGETLGDRSASIQASSAAMSGGNEVLGAVALVAALATARAGWLGDVGGGGRLLAFTVCFFLAYRPLRDLTEARLAWSRAAMAFSDLAPMAGGGADAVEVAGPRPGVPVSVPAVTWPLADLHVEGLVLARGTEAAVSFLLGAGEVTVVAGVTGEGKTTLLRTLLGLEAPRQGGVRYGTTPLTDAPPGLRHRPFAWVPQDSALLTDTLEANVLLGAPPGGADVQATLLALGATSLAAASPTTRLGPGARVLSGGERQWVALCRALATGQPVLLLDEPTSGMDPASQRQVLEAVARLRGVRSVLLVTHRAEPLALADTIVRLEGGEVRVEAGPARRWHAPTNQATSGSR